MYLVLCLHHLYGIQALLKSLLKHHLTQQKMHLTIFIKTMKNFEVFVLHSFYPLHLKSRYKLNIITSQGSGFSLMNPTLAPPAPPGGGILHSGHAVHHRAAADCVDSTDLLLKVELKLQKYFTTETRPIV